MIDCSDFFTHLDNFVRGMSHSTSDAQADITGFRCSKDTCTSSVAVVIVTTIFGFGSAMLGALFAYQYQKQSMERLKRKLTEQRFSERRGRISAEIKVRNLLKKQQHMRLLSIAEEGEVPPSSSSDLEISGQQCVLEKVKNTASEKLNLDDQPLAHNSSAMMIMRSIGTVQSPYTKRMGTPRQGALAPHGRGFIQFDPSVAPMDCLHGIEAYSHIWIIFEFHANTDLSVGRQEGSSDGQTQANTRKTKIRPPRAPKGVKVGQLGTRSPHRPNPLGLSLVRVGNAGASNDVVDWTNKRLYISGLDLVNNTPVYDVKPCVPWDIPGYSVHSDNSALGLECVSKFLRVPDWVSQDDLLPNVNFTEVAEQNLLDLMMQGRLSPFYKANARTDEGYQSAVKALSEILTQDPRASKIRGTKNGTATLMALPNSIHNSYGIFFCKAQVEFVVTKSGVLVISVLDASLENATYVDGIPLAVNGLMREGLSGANRVATF